MKIKFFLLLLVLIAASLTSQEPLHEPDWLPIRDDGREWELSFNKKADDQFLMEWNLAWETRDDWSEIFTFMGQRVQRNINITSYFHQYMENLQKKLGHAKVHYQIGWSDPKSIYYEFWIDEGCSEDQYELARMFIHDDKIIFLRYTAKKMKSDNPNSRHFEIGLKSADLFKILSA